MAYSGKNGLPRELASFVGSGDMLKYILNSNIYNDLKLEDTKEFDTEFKEIWETCNFENIEPLKKIIVIDGGISITDKKNIKVAFIQVGRLYLDMDKIDKLSKDDYYNYLKDTKNNQKVQIIMPLSGFCEESEGAFRVMRKLLYKSIPITLVETLKWLFYKKWNGNYHEKSPNFHCPNCEKKIYLEFDKEDGECSFCSEKIYITDVLSLHLSMVTGSKTEAVAMSYMSILEILMLLEAIKEKLALGVGISEYLFLKDGPMLCGQQLAKIVMRIREFILYTQEENKLIYILGVEKNGSLVEFLERNTNDLKVKGNEAKIAVLTHGFIREKIQCMPKRKGFYGERSNWGEKVLLKNKYGSYVLNITVQRYIKSHKRPNKGDLIGLERIIRTISTIKSNGAENALYPIMRINQEISLPERVSEKLLDVFLKKIN